MTIQDGKPNAMVYDTGKAAGSHMFKSYVERMCAQGARRTRNKGLVEQSLGWFWTEVQA